MAWLANHLKAHRLIFDRRNRASYPSPAGLRLLAVFLLLEGLVGPRRAHPAVMLAAALLLIHVVARVRLAYIGLDGWHQWTASEKNYLIHILPIAIAVFTVMSAARLRALAGDPSLWAQAALTLSSYAVWGFYQEVMYRGILQTELVRRFGAPAGILAATMAYTFGPLHVYYFSTYESPAVYGMFAAVFAIGLYFGTVFHRSGNLFIVGALHAIGDVFLTGLPRVQR